MVMQINSAKDLPHWNHSLVHCVFLWMQEVNTWIITGSVFPIPFSWEW